MATSIVTGGSGFIGTHLCRELIERGHQVRVLDIRSPATPVSGVEYRLCDVTDAESLRREAVTADFVFHLAAQVSVPLCQKDPVGTTRVNFLGTQNVCEWIRLSSPSATLVFASSSAVYGHGGKRGIAIRERDPLFPFSWYAYHKLWGEQLAELYRGQYGLRAVALRLFNVYGPGQDPTSPYSGVISQFLRRLHEGEPLTLFNEGRNTRDFVHVTDVARAFVMAGASLTGAETQVPVLNVGCGEAITVRQLAEKMRTHIQPHGATSTFHSAGPREGDVEDSLADLTRAREVFGFEARLDLESGLADLLDWYRQQKRN